MPPGGGAAPRVKMLGFVGVVARVHFDEYWEWHQQQELRRNHLDRYQELDLAA